VVLIAGLIDRRIVTFAGEGASVARGQRIGLIRFGSRVDIYLPAQAEVFAEIGQTAIGGETVVAEFVPGEEARKLSSVLGPGVTEE
jgi:phosphatidylserine decarboxylase